VNNAEEANDGRTARKPLSFGRLVAALGLGLIGLAAAVAAVAYVGGVDLLLPGSGSGTGGLSDFRQKVDDVKGPATAAFGATSGLGLLAGGTMTGLGMQSGIRMMTLSALAGGGVVLGNGLVK
jgi:hypothetical protein